MSHRAALYQKKKSTVGFPIRAVELAIRSLQGSRPGRQRCQPNVTTLLTIGN